MMTHKHFGLLTIVTVVLFAEIASCGHMTLACQTQMDQQGNPLRSFQTAVPKVETPIQQPTYAIESETGFVPAANRPISTSPGNIQSLLPPVTGPDTWLEQKQPAVHDAEGNPDINELPPNNSTVQPRNGSRVMDRQVRTTSYNESAELVAEDGRVPFGGPASLNISDSVRQLATATAVSMFGCVLLVLGAKFFRRNGTPAKTETVAAKVEQIIQLGNKSTLRLVRIGRQQVLVAADSSGIRSVTAVQPDFESMIEEDKPDEPDAIDFQAALAGYFQSLKNDRSNGAA